MIRVNVSQEITSAQCAYLYVALGDQRLSFRSGHAARQHEGFNLDDVDRSFVDLTGSNEWT
jgi:hypothetical protein